MVVVDPKGNLLTKFERNWRDGLAQLFWFSQTCSHKCFAILEMIGQRKNPSLPEQDGIGFDHCPSTLHCTVSCVFIWLLEFVT